jgi:hypothetical protein
MKRKLFGMTGALIVLLALGLILAGCDTGTGSDNTGGNNTGGNNTGGDNSGSGNTSGDNTGNDNTGSGNTGGDNTGNDNTGGGNTGGDNTGDNDGGTTSQENTFTPPTKAQVQAFLESYRTNTANKIAGENAAVYIKSTTINTYTIGGKSITTNPAAVSEDADAKVKFTIRTILIFDNLTMGERLQIDNFRIALMDALKKWLQQQGFKNIPSTNITTGNTVFG